MATFIHQRSWRVLENPAVSEAHDNVVLVSGDAIDIFPGNGCPLEADPRIRLRSPLRFRLGEGARARPPGDRVVAADQCLQDLPWFMEAGVLHELRALPLEQCGHVLDVGAGRRQQVMLECAMRLALTRDPVPAWCTDALAAKHL